MNRRVAETLRAYGFAVAAVAATATLRLALDTVWADEFPALLFYLAVSLSAWFGGLGPGLVATGLSGLIVAQLWLPPAPGDWLGLAVFMGFGLVVSYLHERRLRAATGAVAALRASEERHRGLVERNLAGMFRSRLDGTILDCNPAFVHLVGHACRADVLARNAADFYEEPRDRVTLLRHLQGSGPVTNRALRWRRVDGSIITVRVNVHEVEPGMLEGIAVDVSDQARAEQAERAAMELQAITKLANAAAHEINNPLTVVIGNLALVQRRIGADEHIAAAVRAAGEITEIVDRMQHITRVEQFHHDPALGEVLDIRQSSPD